MDMYYKISKGKYFEMSGNQIIKILNNDKITYDKISNKYLKYFPFCMRFIFNKLITNKHIKNGGRLQLSLFLKGIGLSLYEALKFWNKFEKGINYNYYVNYYYVQKNYSSISCSKIMDTHTNNGDCNGCPFKISEKQQNGIKLAKRYFIQS